LPVKRGLAETKQKACKPCFNKDDRNIRVGSYEKNRKGFSLIELIITVAIMAVLTAIVSPSLIKHIARSKETACKVNCQEL
jgi:prepilin-type N-terminal cleavage/methylation domain-containing protein